MSTAATRQPIDLSAPEFREMHRTFTVDRAGIDVEQRTVPLSFASETPVDRWFGEEILDISTDACDLTRLNNGGAVLVNHDPRDQVGVVLSATIDTATKKARCIAKFSRSPRGEEIFQDIRDGIRSLVSVGYIVRKMVLQSVNGEVETYRVTEWQPLEVSVVAVPADTSVGVGRSARLTTEAPASAATGSNSRPSSSMADNATTTTENRSAATTETKPAPAANVTVNEAEIRTSAAAAERQRIKDLNAAAKTLAERHPDKAESFRSLAARCAETGDDLNAFNRTVLADILKTDTRTAPVTQDADAARVGLSGKDVKRYSLLRAVRCVLEGREPDGLEGECNKELIRKLERQPKGFFLPDEVLLDRRSGLLQANRTGIFAAPPSAGGFTISEDLLASEFVAFLRNQARVVGLGARYISGLKGDVTIPRQLSGASAYWVSETGSITQSAATFGQVIGKPRRVGTSVPYTKQFLSQTSLDAENFVINDSDEAIAAELDRVAISGAGGAEPLGILNLASGDLAGTVTFGAAATWAKYLAFFQTLAEAKTLGLGIPAYLTTPASAVKAMSITKASAGTSQFIWENDMIGTFKAQWSNQFPSSGTQNQVIFGAFSEVIYLEWAGRDVVVDPYSGKKEGTIEVTIQRLMDCVVRRAKSFVRSTDSGAQ